MPYIDTIEQAARLKALQPQQQERVPNFFDQLIGGAVSGFEQGLGEQAKREAQDRAFALEAAGKGVSAKTLDIVGPKQEGQELGQGQFELGGLVFGKPSGTDQNKLDEFITKETIKSGIRTKEKEAADTRTRLKKIDTDLLTIDESLSMGDALLKEAELIKDKLGPGKALWEAGKQLVGKADPVFLQQKTKLSAGLAEYIRKMSGTAASDQERSFIKSFQPNESDTFEQLQAKIMGLREFMQNKRGSLLKARQSGGIPSLEPTMSPPRMPPGAVRVIRNKKTGEVRYLDAQGNAVNG